jgi:hypothetical protein
MGLMKTIGEGAERSGIGSSQILTVPLLHNSIQNKASLLLGYETYRTGCLRILRNTTHVNPIKPKRKRRPNPKDTYPYMCDHSIIFVLSLDTSSYSWFNSRPHGTPSAHGAIRHFPFYINDVIIMHSNTGLRWSFIPLTYYKRRMFP